MDGVATVTVMQSRVSVRLGWDTLIVTILFNDHVIMRGNAVTSVCPSIYFQCNLNWVTFHLDFLHVYGSWDWRSRLGLRSQFETWLVGLRSLIEDSFIVNDMMRWAEVMTMMLMIQVQLRDPLRKAIKNKRDLIKRFANSFCIYVSCVYHGC